MIAVSACLCGVNCKYSGGNNFCKNLVEKYKADELVLICPEELGGLQTPRVPCEIVDGSGKDVLDGRSRVKDKSGKDLTANFISGAIIALEIVKNRNITTAILKANSPSCGCGYIYDGTFSGKLIEGNGVTAELFIRNGIRVFNEKNFTNG